MAASDDLRLAFCCHICLARFATNPEEQAHVSFAHAQEASEIAPLDFPKTLETAKSEPKTDGPKCCEMCGVMVKIRNRDLDNARSHILKFHRKEPRWKCHLCDYQSYRWESLHMRNHVKHFHKITSNVRDSMEDNHANLQEPVNKLLETCFGLQLTMRHQAPARIWRNERPDLLESSTDGASKTCRECGCVVKLNQVHGVTLLQTHILKAHLKESRIICKLCDYKSFSWSAHNIPRHLLNVHKIIPSMIKESKAVEDRYEELCEPVNVMLGKCFGVTISQKSRRFSKLYESVD